MTIRIVIADDHGMIREGLRMIFQSVSGMVVVGEACNGRETIREVEKLKPDIVVMDIAMPGLNGIEAAARIHELKPSVGIIVLSMHSTADFVYRAMKAGARGYVLKEYAGRELIEAVNRVHGGHRYLCEKVQEVVVDGYLYRCDEVHKGDPFERLSVREREVLQMVVEGKSSAEIAVAVYLSRKTVETYRSRIMRKLGARKLPDLIKLAIAHGLSGAE